MDVINRIPAFDSDDSQAPQEQAPLEEVKQDPGQPVVDEKETPSEPPADKPSDEDETPVADNTGLDDREKQGLLNERAKLLREISELKGQRREIKQEQLFKVDQKIEDLKDVNPTDVELIDRVLRAKGYMTKDEATKLSYSQIQADELNKFLDKYPEYKPENDANDTNWALLQRELGYYRMPDNARQLQEVLERAHKGIIRVSSGQNIPAKKHAIKVAGAGAGGAQRSSSSKTLDPRYRAELERGGWSEEEIKKIELRLPE